MVSLDEIRGYVVEKGPKKVRNPNFQFLFWLRKALFNVETTFSDKYLESTKDRIEEVLSDNSQIILSGSNNTIIIYNDNTGRLERANYDVASGQPVPDSAYPIEHTEIIPASLIEVVYFSGCQPGSTLAGWDRFQRTRQATGFLEKLIKLSDNTPILEIGKNTGDSFNRYFPVRRYHPR
jgi:hypothetical protein